MNESDIVKLFSGYLPPAGCVGLIGAGRIGRRLQSVAETAGAEVLLCDPPLSISNAADQFDAICEQWGNGMGGCNPDMPDDETFLPKESLAKNCDLIAVQVPLTSSGPFPTSGLIDRAFLAMCRPNARILCFSDARVVADDVRDNPSIIFDIPTRTA